MTINSEYSPNKYVANGVTVDFSFDWNAVAIEYVKVLLEDSVTGVQTKQILDVDYTATITENDGIISFITAPESGNNVIIARDVTLTQETAFSQNNSYRGLSHENTNDKQMAAIQENAEEINRSLKFSLGSTSSTEIPEPENGLVLGWDADGDLENKEIIAGDVLPAVANTFIIRNGDNSAYETSILPITNETNIADNTDAINSLIEKHISYLEIEWVDATTIKAKGKVRADNNLIDIDVPSFINSETFTFGLSTDYYAFFVKRTGQSTTLEWDSNSDGSGLNPTPAIEGKRMFLPIKSNSSSQIDSFNKVSTTNNEFVLSFTLKTFINENISVNTSFEERDIGISSSSSVKECGLRVRYTTGASELRLKPSDLPVANETGLYIIKSTTSVNNEMMINYQQSGSKLHIKPTVTTTNGLIIGVYNYKVEL